MICKPRKCGKKYFAEMSSLHPSDKQTAMELHLFKNMHIYCYMNLSMEVEYKFNR